MCIMRKSSLCIMRKRSLRIVRKRSLCIMRKRQSHPGEREVHQTLTQNDAEEGVISKNYNKEALCVMSKNGCGQLVTTPIFFKDEEIII